MKKPRWIKDRSNQLLEAWCKGILQGGHTPTWDDVRATGLACMARATSEYSDLLEKEKKA